MDEVRLRAEPLPYPGDEKLAHLPELGEHDGLLAALSKLPEEIKKHLRLSGVRGPGDLRILGEELRRVADLLEPEDELQHHGAPLHLRERLGNSLKAVAHEALVHRSLLRCKLAEAVGAYLVRKIRDDAFVRLEAAEYEGRRYAPEPLHRVSVAAPLDGLRVVGDEGARQLNNGQVGLDEETLRDGNLLVARSPSEEQASGQNEETAEDQCRPSTILVGPFACTVENIQIQF